ADSDALFNSAIAFYDKMNLRSQEVELYKKTALGLYSEEPLFFSRACAYFIDRKLYGEARELIKDAEAKTPADGQLIFNARTGLYEKLIAEGVETAANAAELDSIYEKFLLDKLISDDKKYYTHTVYFNFLKNNSLLDKKIEKLTAAFGAPDGQQSDLLLINLLMQNSHAAEAKALVNKFVSSRKNFSSFISASRAMRHYSELLPAMKFALASLELASTVEEKETLYYELASNLSRFYFIDLRYLIFKNAAVELIEQRCDDLLVNLITISSSRRFMRANYDAIRVALRQYLSRLGAVHYYEKLIENKVSASRAKYLSELAEIYDDINMSDAAYSCREKLCKDYTDSVYLAGALKSMVSYHQRSLKPDQAASKACAALTAYADIKSEKGFASARQALEQLMNFDAAGFDGEKSALNVYYRGVYDFLNASRGTAFDKKWIDSKLVSLVSKLELSFGARLEIIDGMLKNSPYDRELLKAKEGYLLSQVSLNDTAAARKALENFYEQNYFADGDFMNKYLQYLNRENLIESKIAELKKAAGSGAKAPHKLKLLAECCFFISDFEQSEKWFDEFVKYAPSDSASLMKLASLKRSFGKSGEAVKLLQQIISLEPSNKTAYITAGDIIGLDKSRPWAEAEAFFSKITSIDPENNDNYVELATIYWDYFKYDEGLAVLADRRRKAGSDFIFGREIASLFELNGSIEVAIPEYISVICAPDEPARDNSYQQFGGDGAENESENGRRYEHYNYRYERPETADVIECRARLMTLYKKEKFKKLIDAGFEKFMAASPLNYKLYYEYSKLLIEFGMGGKAFEVIKKSYPAVNRAYYFIQMAGLLERVRKNAEARELYYKAIAMEPESHSNYGDALDFFNRFAMEADYAKTVKMRAEKFIQDQYYMEEYAKYMMNFKSAKDNSNYREAVWALEKLIAQNPLRVSYRNLLADAKIKLEGMKAAIAYIEGVIAASESEKDKSKKFHIDDIVRLKETLARLLAKDRQTARALEIRKELIYDNPGERGFADSLAELALAGDGLKTVSDFISGLDEKKMKQANKLFLIARFYSKLNMFDEAADAYKKLAGLNPNDSSVVTSYFELCVRTRKFGEAKKLMPRYMQLAEAAGGETERQAYEDCVSLYMQTGDSSEACLLYDKYLKKILDGFKPDPASYVYYSYQYVNAIDWLVRLLESNS
ncbi:MAG TPA: hypothetical protein PKL57_11490, partial [Candidatus Wallbacteria bacterium]|nr:hypothetical protein [Candidatus Wallbacteria bacterium]